MNNEIFNETPAAKRYVVGFAFNEDVSKVLLRLKNKPPWQRGRYNGVGGKIEAGETPMQAMDREWSEETPAGTGSRHWRHFAVLHGSEPSADGPGLSPFELHCFFCVGDIVHPVTALQQHGETEKMHIFPRATLPPNVIPNVRWTLPMALSCFYGERCKSFTIHEEV